MLCSGSARVDIFSDYTSGVEGTIIDSVPQIPMHAALARFEEVIISRGRTDKEARGNRLLGAMGAASGENLKTAPIEFPSFMSNTGQHYRATCLV